MPINDHLNHTPDDEGKARCEQIRLRAIEFEAVMDAMCPHTDHLDAAKHYLELTRMFAIKAIVMQYPGQPLNPSSFGNVPTFEEPQPGEVQVGEIPVVTESVNMPETAPQFTEARVAAGLHPENENPQSDAPDVGLDLSSTTDLSATPFTIKEEESHDGDHQFGVQETKDDLYDFTAGEPLEA
jgi:hypothetical protein